MLEFSVLAAIRVTLYLYLHLSTRIYPFIKGLWTVRSNWTPMSIKRKLIPEFTPVIIILMPFIRTQIDSLRRSGFVQSNVLYVRASIGNGKRIVVYPSRWDTCAERIRSCFFRAEASLTASCVKSGRSSISAQKTPKLVNCRNDPLSSMGAHDFEQRKKTKLFSLKEIEFKSKDVDRMQRSIVRGHVGSSWVTKSSKKKKSSNEMSRLQMLSDLPFSNLVGQMVL